MSGTRLLQGLLTLAWTEADLGHHAHTFLSKQRMCGEWMQDAGVCLFTLPGCPASGSKIGWSTLVFNGVTCPGPQFGVVVSGTGQTHVGIRKL
ncbi:mCG1036071 [Mus musculus]|nr:mCG1036071 [Mus musculus]